jgi:SAM-dependent methyltransferase
VSETSQTEVRSYPTRSYSSAWSTPIGLAREAWCLYQFSREMQEGAKECIEDVRGVEERVLKQFDLELRDLDILEIGPGQLLGQMIYFAVRNRVVGIDLDLIVNGFSPLAYLRMLRVNGPERTAKTIGRKLLGVDRKFRSALTRELSLRRLPRLDVRQMDVCNMSFPSQSFDFVYSRSVFHHLPDPGAALDAIVGALKAGGVVYILIHLYTSQTGCLDPRIYTERRDEVLGWVHLRPQLRKSFNNQNVYLNKLRLHEWRAMFDEKMPGAQYTLGSRDSETLDAARSLQGQGELTDYSLEELTTGDLAVLWEKPGSTWTGSQIAG